MAKSGFVAIIGRPNSGKSTLLNQVLGSRISIVTPKAQTTRERVLGILTEDTGQIVFIDTPGIHRAEAGGINEYMVREAREALEAPSIIWYLLDPTSGPQHEAAVLELLKGTQTPVVLLINKADTLRGAGSRARAQALAGEIQGAARQMGVAIERIMPVSATTGKGVAELLELTWASLEEGPLYYQDPDQLSDRPTRFFVAEMIREQLMLRLGEEVPYSCAVQIEKFDEKSRPVRIEAVIHVERESQKGIVIGKGAHKIKEIGQEARKCIEEFLGQKIFLGLQVKVLKDWTKDREALKRMGYDLPKEKPRGKREN